MSASPTVAALRQELEARFPSARPLARPHHGVLPCGIDLIDELLPGGLPRGALSVLAGPPSSGKAALAARWLAALSARGRTMAWVSDPLPPAAGLARQGVDLSRLLAVRGRGQGARIATEALLESGVFDLLVLDDELSEDASATWPRLQRAAAGSRQSLLVLGPMPPVGDPLRYYASVVMRVRRERSGGLSMELAKSRYGRAGSSIRLDAVPDPAGFALLPGLPGLVQDWALPTVV
jgi:hypothetical protein